ncbi:hypothetical protein G6F37_001288 [Rhizopus arrhizus]|nr:hypothetical protein G6F38_009550 [Rhizopus arrhizus]KAG1163366.1 hypothetical protein G6F37_001288 [Rhizopus arrhizus]
MVRAQMEYGLAVSVLNHGHLKKLESCQNECIRRISGGSSRSSVNFMLHLIQQPSMTDRVSILQANFLKRFTDLPDDLLLQKLLPHL